MNHTSKNLNEVSTGFDRTPTRHASWKNTRRHTALRLIRFS
ncbi:hypothetical protein [Robiginitalea sediminis]|nr:hypothetical protein [Robiginitalea sediminis]